MDQEKKGEAVRRRARGLQRIASILQVAEKVFALMGYEKATTNHIAAEAGISPGSLYQFFANKEEIAQALATRYAEELRKAYETIFSLEMITLPLSMWIDFIINVLFGFHFAHDAFMVLWNTPISSQVSRLTQALPQEMQVQFERGFALRAPQLSEEVRNRSALMSCTLIRAALVLVLTTEEGEREPLISELKTMLHRYLEPLLS